MDFFYYRIRETMKENGGWTLRLPFIFTVISVILEIREFGVYKKKCSLLFVKSKFGNNNTCIAFINCHSNQFIHFQYHKIYSVQLRYRNMLKTFRWI